MTFTKLELKKISLAYDKLYEANSNTYLFGSQLDFIEKLMNEHGYHKVLIRDKFKFKGNW